MLPIHPHPISGELLSSWMTRLAIQNNFYLHEFYKTVMGIESALFTRDIDRLNVPGLVACLSKNTGLKEACIESCTLRSFSGILFESVNQNSHSRWILPQGIYHRTRKLKGLQYCPHCLAEDSVRYFRASWRLSFVTICSKHHCLLLDTCLSCQASVDYLRVGIGRHSFETPCDDIGICHKCLNPLWLFCAPKLDEGTKIFAHHYCQFIKEFERGNIRVSTLDQPFCLSEFNGLWILISCFMGIRSLQLRQRIKNLMGIELIGGEGVSFDYWPLEERFKALVIAFWMLEVWPNRFVELVSGSKFSKSVFSDYMHETPFWLAKIVNKYLNKSTYVVTDEEIITAAKYLRKKSGHVSVAHLARLLNINASTCRARLLPLQY